VDPPTDSQALRRRLGLTFPLLADPDRKVIRAWGVADPAQPISLPVSFVVALGGMVTFVYRGETVKQRPAASLLLEAARKARRR